MMQLISMLFGQGRRNARPPRALSDGFSRGESLRLPPGEILAEEGVRRTGKARSGSSVTPICEEAYVVVRLNRSTRCYATWYPGAERWELLCIEAERGAPVKTRN